MNHRKKPTVRPITLTWSCGCQTKSWERDPVARRELRSVTKREACPTCRREEAQQRRRDVGADLDEDEFAALDELFRRAPMSVDEAELILSGEVRRAA